MGGTMYDSITTHTEAEQLLAGARTPDNGKPVARNTRLFKRGEDYAIQLHQTDVVTYHPDGTFTLESNGWRTITTKDRINRFSPAHLFTDNGIWYLGTSDDYREKFALYEDGMLVSRSGIPIGGGDPAMKMKFIERRKKKVDALVRDYIKGYLANIKKNGLADPGMGDCFGCLMTKGRKPGEMDEAMGVDHLLGHFREKYYVPSLLWKAVNEQGYKDPGFIWHRIRAGMHRTAADALRAYFRKRKLRLAELL